MPSGILLQCKPMLFHMRKKHPGIRLRQIPNRINSQTFQPFTGRFSGKQKMLHWKVPQFSRNFLRKQGMHQIRLFEIPSHFSEQTVRRNPDIDRKSKGFFDFTAQLIGKCLRFTVHSAKILKFCPRFIDAVRNYHIRIAPQ